MLGAADLAHATAVRIDAPRDAILVLAAILEPAAASVVAEMKRIVGSLHVEMEGRAPGTFPEVTCTRGRVWQVGTLYSDLLDDYKYTLRQGNSRPCIGQRCQGDVRWVRLRATQRCRAEGMQCLGGCLSGWPNIRRRGTQEASRDGLAVAPALQVELHAQMRRERRAAHAASAQPASAEGAAVELLGGGL